MSESTHTDASETQSACAAHSNPSRTSSGQPANRPFRPRQFFFGMVLATAGICLMLFVAAGALHDAGAEGSISLPATGLCMILGLMMLGGGFGQMATAIPNLNDLEFQKLLAGTPDKTPSKESSEAPRKESAAPAETLPAPNPQEDTTANQTAAATEKSGLVKQDQSAEHLNHNTKDSKAPRDSFVSTVMSDVMASQG